MTQREINEIYEIVTNLKNSCDEYMNYVAISEKQKSSVISERIQESFGKYEENLSKFNKFVNNYALIIKEGTSVLDIKNAIDKIFENYLNKN